MNSLELLQSYFKGEHLEFSGDVKEEIRNQNKQSLAPFLYFVYGQPFVKAYIGSTIIQERFYKLQDEITALFNENKIKHYYIKGSVLSKIYPDPALRTRGDIDVVVQECDYDRARKVLEDNGYEYLDEADHHIGFNKNGSEVELHRRLLPTDDPYYKYFKDAFEYTKIKKDYLYELNDNYHFVFLVAHLNKHLRVGEGLRSVLDFYYMNEKLNLDFSFIDEKLKQVKLYKLYQNISNMIYVITNKKIYGYTGQDVTELLDFMIVNGIHGKTGLDTTFEKHIALNGNSKFKYLCSRLFIGKVERKELYPKMSKCVLFYPFIIIHRFFYLLLNKKQKLLKTINANKNELNPDFFEKFGIVDNDK